MGPVRIKYYGLMWLTKPTYVVLQSITLFVCVVLMALGFVIVLLADFIALVGATLLGLGLLLFVAESIELIVMLRKFARAEAELQAKLAALDDSEPAPSAPSSTALQSPANVSPPNTNIQP